MKKRILSILLICCMVLTIAFPPRVLYSDYFLTELKNQQIIFISLFIRHNFHNILNPTIQRRTNLHEYLCGDMPISSHLGDGSWADTRLFTQVFFLHVLIDEQLPEFFITHRHKYLLRTDIQKMLCRLAEHSVYCSHTAKAYSNT